MRCLDATLLSMIYLLPSGRRRCQEPGHAKKYMFISWPHLGYKEFINTHKRQERI